MSHVLSVNSSNGSYSVDFFESIGSYNHFSDEDVQFLLVADENLWEIYGDKFHSWQLIPKHLVKANENTKTLSEVDALCRWLVRHGATKTTVLIGFGGGVIQDLVTFTASIFHRGCSWEFVPTTLLSQSDSCIGSKCGINILPHKNQLGTVYGPRKIVIIEELLQTLSSEEIASGFGEIIKLSITGTHEFYAELIETLNRNYPFFPKGEDLRKLIFLSLKAKKVIIEEDEHEKGSRRVLNYGHSFGHALEALSSNTIKHGLAVVFGMDLINFLGVKWGITQDNFYLEFKSLLNRYYKKFLPTSLVDAEMLLDFLKSDKKMAFGKMNFAVPIMPGQITIVEKDLDSSLKSLITDYLRNECGFFIN